MKKYFYDQQNDLTGAKIRIYEEYLQRYLPKILLTFKKCFIADLFCGAGRNGKEAGSPLVLLEKTRYILSSEILRKAQPQVYILFNDGEKKNIENLKKELEGFMNEFINIFPPQNADFEEILSNILKQFKNRGIPKFFFLDPFTYSNVSMDNLRDLMGLQYSEILLFLPVFHGYRFASDKTMKPDHKTRLFLEAFTTKGIFDYQSIDDFMFSIKDKLRKELRLDFVRPVLIDSGPRKNALFLLTKNQQGMLAMNKVVFKISENPASVKIKNLNQPSLFGTPATSAFELFAKNLENQLKKHEKTTNSEIVKFAIEEGFLPKHAKTVLNKLYKNNHLAVFSRSGDEVNSSSGWNIAEKISKIMSFSLK